MKKLIRITTVPISLDKLLGRQLTFMNQFYEVTAISADEKELPRIAAKYGVKHHHVEMTRTITPLKDLAAVWNLYQFLKKEQPEIVHTHTPKAGIVGMVAAYFAGVPVRMHTVAGLPLLEAQGIKRQVLNMVEKITYAFATKVYPNSFAMRDIIVKEGFCARDKLKVLGNGSSNGIDTEYFSRAAVPSVTTSTLREELGITANDFVFIFVGRLVGDKGINELVAAFKVIEQSTLHHPNAQAPNHRPCHAERAEAQTPNHLITRAPKLLLVGPLETELDALKAETLAEIEHNPNIITVGFQADVRIYFAIAEALVFPSYREGFPNVVMQAGAMGLPSIVTDINGCNEIIVEGVNGTIVPAKDALKLAEAMHSMYDDATWCRHLKQMARPMIASRYRQAVVWEALLEEYRNR